MKSSLLRSRVVRWCWLLGFLAASAYVLLSGGGTGSATSTSQLWLASQNADAYPRDVGFESIENLRVGDRVYAVNPTVSDEERRSWGEPQWTDWRCVNLEMLQVDGGVLHIEMIRPQEWLDSQDLEPSAELFLDLPEVGAYGAAKVITITDAPVVRRGEGQVVTATFAHPPSTDVLEIQFEGCDEPIGVTDNHLFWSVDRKEFRPISEMLIGERVLTFHGDTKRIEQKLARPGPQVVYNLEVYGEHVYFVGEDGILVHNLYKDARGRWHRNNGQFAKRLGRPPKPKTGHGNARSSPEAQKGYYVVDTSKSKTSKLRIVKVGVVEAKKGVTKRFLEQRDNIVKVAAAKGYTIKASNLKVVPMKSIKTSPGARGKIYDWEKNTATTLIGKGHILPGHIRPR